MLSARVLMAISVLFVAGVTRADDQIDKEIKGKETVRTLSVVDLKAGTESVYAVPPEVAKDLPKGAVNGSKLTGDAKNKLEKAIETVVSKDPVNVIKLGEKKEAATAACLFYRRRCYAHYRPLYYPNYYYGGGFYRPRPYPYAYGDRDGDGYREGRFEGAGYGDLDGDGYREGRFEGNGGRYASVWPSYGHYHYPRYGGCHWGW